LRRAESKVFYFFTSSSAFHRPLTSGSTSAWCATRNSSEFQKKASDSISKRWLYAIWPKVNRSNTI